MSLSRTFPSYLIGTMTIGVGIACFIAPRGAYQLFGLPLPEKSPNNDNKNLASSNLTSTPSPYVYAMGVRQFSLGLMLIAFEAAGNTQAVATMAGAISLIGAVDGGIVWMNGGALRSKAWGHWNGTIMAAAWYGWRFWRL